MRAVALGRLARPVVVGRGRLRFGFVGAAVATWLAACLAVGAWVRLEAIEVCYDIAAKRHERTELVDENRKLGLELARLSALDRIEAIASGKLGMKFPAPDQVVKLP